MFYSHEKHLVANFWLHMYCTGNYVETLLKKSKREKQSKLKGYAEKNNRGATVRI